MIKKLCFLPLLLVASCSNENVGADNYTFGVSEYEKTSMQVNVKTFTTLNELHRTAISMGIKEDPNLAAFATIEGDTCTVYMMHPEVAYEPEWYGHEFAHCFFGRWH